MLKIVHLNNFYKGARFSPLISQGLLEHPDVEFWTAMPVISLGRTVAHAVEAPDRAMVAADYIFRPNDEHFEIPSADVLLDRHDLWGKVVYYDFQDSDAINDQRLQTCAAYTKRSWPVGPLREPPPPTSRPVLPVDFGILAEYTYDDPPDERDIDLAYLFPDNPVIGKRRHAVYKEIFRQRKKLGNVHIGSPTSGAQAGRRGIFDLPENNPFLEYLRILKRSRIVFTAFPDAQDGDSRTWEAFSSGALVFMDRTSIPSPAPFVHGEHCMIYDATDEDSIRRAVELAMELLADEPRRRALAEAGYAHVMAHHRGVHRVDAILKWLADENKVLEKHVVIPPSPA